MYYVLNYLPLVIQTVIFTMAIKFGVVFNFDIVIYGSILLFGLPLYLLIVNIISIKKHSLSYVKSMLNMLLVIVSNVLIMMIAHKIQTGQFIGDVPLGVYGFLLLVPSIIVLAGMTISIFQVE